jgi:hypothetical protein
MAERHIKNHRDIVSIGEFNRLSSSSPLELRLCTIHKKDVKRNAVLHGQSPQAFGGNPPFEYVFEGCCDEAINKELAFIQDFVANNSSNK